MLQVQHCPTGFHQNNWRGTSNPTPSTAPDALLEQCNRPMRLDAFLAQWNPPLYKKFLRETMTPAQYKRRKESL